MPRSATVTGPRVKLDSTAELLTALAARLVDRPPIPSRHSIRGRTSAGVCVPLHPGPRGLEVLLIKRTGNTRHHARELAFPGGRPDPADVDLADTALRETEEELGLRRADLRLLGPLSPVPTATSHYLLHPFAVALAQGAAVVGHPDEVAVVIVMPLVDLFEGRIPYREVVGWNSPVFDFDAGSMYGASAHVLLEVATLIADLTGSAIPDPVPTDSIPWE